MFYIDVIKCSKHNWMSYDSGHKTSKRVVIYDFAEAYTIFLFPEVILIEA